MKEKTTAEMIMILSVFTVIDTEYQTWDTEFDIPVMYAEITYIYALKVLHLQ